MVKTTRVALMTLVGLALGSCPFAVLSPARAFTTSDQPAAILVWPKIVVDTSGRFSTAIPPTITDTVIQLSNTDQAGPKGAHCFYINGNSHCGNHPSVVCQSSSDCNFGGQFDACVPGWSEVDFDVVITAEQPLIWSASQGRQRGQFPIEQVGFCPERNAPCATDAQCTGATGSCQIFPGGNNLGSGIPPVPEDPFVGELKCIQSTVTTPLVPDQTATSNRLKGEATIVHNIFESGVGIRVDPEKYNAVGLKFKGPEATVPPNELHLDDVQYASCPSVLLLPFLFEGISFPGEPLQRQGDLTLVPCNEDFLDQIPGKVTAQFIVYNEFEQRFSTSRLVDCFLESRLGNIDTPDPDRSIFSFAVGATIQGYARIRGVGGQDPNNPGKTLPRGLIGVARETTPIGSAAYNLFQTGMPDFSKVDPDVITLP